MLFKQELELYNAIRAKQHSLLTERFIFYFQSMDCMQIKDMHIVCISMDELCARPQLRSVHFHEHF